MSDDNGNYPKVQLGSFISGDQFVFRAESGSELKEVLESVAENADDTIKALNALKQAGVANGIFTGDSQKGGRTTNNNGSAPAGRKEDAAPPSGEAPSCKHGPYKDLAGRGYKNRWYCSARNRDEQCKPLPG